jgi:hypothetical protein
VVQQSAEALFLGWRSFCERRVDLYAAVALIKDHLAFYPDRVDAIEEQPGA